MLVLFETAAGFAVFKLLKEKKLKQSENLYLDFEDPESASKIVKLKYFQQFKDTHDALKGITGSIEGKISKPLKKLLKKLVSEEAQEELAVADAKIGSMIKEKFSLQCVSNSNINELMRCIRSQMDSLVTGLRDDQLSMMARGLAHSLSRYKLKFSPDKVDTMIVQAIALLDDLDKEINNYIMRAREWYGWHFPELSKLVPDNMNYARLVLKIGDRENLATSDLSDILTEEDEANIKSAAEISMGTEISEEDVENISYLCDEVVKITNYRAQLYDYLKSRMGAVAPNLTLMVGELVGARLISHAGSLMNLAKHPSSTVQILGAEKALFRALKAKHDTPKYGLIYHASLVGSATPKNKGKMSRMLAAKTALAIRVDALGEETDTTLGLEQRMKLERRIAELEHRGIQKISGSGKKQAKFDKYENKSEVHMYNPAADSTLHSKKRKADDDEESTPKKIKVESNGDGDGTMETSSASGSEKKKKKKKRQSEDGEAGDSTKKKKKIKQEPSEDGDGFDVSQDSISESGKKKKKKKKHAEEDA